jgi:O-6-methylguanine DNA methyltransferase
VRNTSMNPAVYCLFETDIGCCAVLWHDNENASLPPAIVAFQLPEATPEMTEYRVTRWPGATHAPNPPATITTLIKRVRRHLIGDLQDFRDVELDLESSGPFSQQVYEAARAIEAGETRSYGALAASINHPGAARAVGQALGRNPIGLIIPCHRVLAAGRKIGGFSAHGGQATKMRMLAIEGAGFQGTVD